MTTDLAAAEASTYACPYGRAHCRPGKLCSACTDS